MKLLLRRSRNRKTINEIARGGGAVKADPTLTVVAAVPLTEQPNADEERESTKATKRNIRGSKAARKKRIRGAKKSKTANVAEVREYAKPDPIDTEDRAKAKAGSAKGHEEEDDHVKKEGKGIGENNSVETGTAIRKKRATKKSKKKKKVTVVQEPEERQEEMEGKEKGSNPVGTDKPRKYKIDKSKKTTKPGPIDTKSPTAASAVSPNSSLASPKSVNTIKVDNRKKKSRSKRRNYDESRQAPSPVPEEDESMWSDVEEGSTLAEESVVDQHQTYQTSWNILNNLLKLHTDNVDVVVDTPKAAADGAWGLISNLWNNDADTDADPDATLDEASTYDNTVDESAFNDENTYESSLRESYSQSNGSYSQSNGSYTTATSGSSALYGTATGSMTTTSEGPSFESESFSQSSHADTLESDMSPRVYKRNKKRHGRKKHRRQFKNPRPTKTDRQAEQNSRPPMDPSRKKHKGKAGFMKAVSRSRTESPDAENSQGKGAPSASLEMSADHCSSKNDTTKPKSRSKSPFIALKKARSNSPQLDLKVKSASRAKSPVPLNKMRSLSNMIRVRGDSPAISEPCSVATEGPESVATKEPDSVATKEPATVATEEPESVATKEPESMATKEPDTVETDPVEKKEPAMVEKVEEKSLADTKEDVTFRVSDKRSVAKSSISKYSIKSSPLLGAHKRHRSLSPGIFDKMLLLKAARSTTPDISTSGAPAPRIVPHQSKESDHANDTVDLEDDAEMSKEETKPAKEHNLFKTKWTASEDAGSPSVEISVCDEGREEESTLHTLSAGNEDREEAPSFPLIVASESEQHDDPARDDISVETAELMKEAQAMLA